MASSLIYLLLDFLISTPGPMVGMQMISLFSPTNLTLTKPAGHYFGGVKWWTGDMGWEARLVQDWHHTRFQSTMYRWDTASPSLCAPTNESCTNIAPAWRKEERDDTVNKAQLAEWGKQMDWNHVAGCIYYLVIIYIVWLLYSSKF